MLKQRIITVIAALALLIAGIGSYGIVADAQGHPTTPQAHACGGSGSSGGSC